MAHPGQHIDFEILWRKIHDSLTPEEEKVLQRWLSEDAKHRLYFEHMQRFYQQEGQVEHSPVNTPAAWEKVQQITNHQKQHRYFSFARIAAIAACITLLIGGGLLWQYAKVQPETKLSTPQNIVPGTDKAVLFMDDGTFHELSAGKRLNIETSGVQINSHGTSLSYLQKENENEHEVKYNTLKIPRGGKFFLTLSDSTKIWLNSETTLRYPVRFSGHERKIELTGEAYFEVKEHEAMPFLVVSGGQVVRVLGTSFNVSSYQDDSLVYTTLVEGKVKVYLQDTPEVQQSLIPGNQSILSKKTEKIEQIAVNTQLYTAWKDDKFIFQDQSLDQIMQTLARWYDVEVAFKNEKARNLKFTGEIERYENFEKVLMLIEKTNEVNINIEGRYVTIE